MLIQAIAGTLAGCVGCQAGVELLQRQVKDSLNLFTLATCVFVSVEGLIFQSKMFTVRQAIPTRITFPSRVRLNCAPYMFGMHVLRGEHPFKIIQSPHPHAHTRVALSNMTCDWKTNVVFRIHLKIVVIYFVVNLCNNYAMKCDIYFPLFFIFKSGSLLANILLGFTLRNQYYTRKEIFSVVIVTLGIILFTLASYEPKNYTRKSEALRFFSVQPFFIGIFLMTAALMLSAYLGVCQEDMYRSYGKHAKESMFMVHFLSIPGFILLGDEISQAFYAANHTAPLSVFGYNLILPTAWGYILGICFLQYICIHNVYRLTTLTTSLNVTMVITLRKFLSLFVSFVAFGNPFNIYHACGAAFVFLGSLMFSNII